MTDYTSAEFWAGAPDRAKGYLPNSADDYPCWVDGDYVMRTDADRGWILDRGIRRKSEKIIPRPTTQPAAWNGPEDGLPTTGTVCEYNAHTDPARGKELWCGVEIKYLSEWSVVLLCVSAPNGHEGAIGVELSSSVYKGLENRFRPIRTPEQKAAEEREAAIEKMHGIYLRGASTHCGGIAALYDHGLRFKDDAK